MPENSTSDLITAVFAKTGFKISRDDPAFILVELNRLILENEAAALSDKLALVTKNFDKTATDNVNLWIDTANQATGIFQKKILELEAKVNGLSLPDFLEKRQVPEAPASKSHAITNVYILMIFTAGILFGIILSYIGYLFLKA
jgi:hypothetical protein